METILVRPRTASPDPELKSMPYDEDKLRRVFERTDGACHICRRKLLFSNYGRTDKRDCWEVDHSLPRSRGGSDRLNNLYVAHIRCNRSKGSRNSRSVRGKNGFQAAPLSTKAKTRNTVTGGVLGVMAGYILVPPPFRLAAILASALVGAIAGATHEPK